MKDKNTKKSQETSKHIQKCLLDALEERKLNDITVSYLCQVAQINRGTFYLHFNSIQDVFDRLENDFFDEIMNEVNLVKIYSLDATFYLAIIDIILRNKALSKWIGSDYNESALMKKLRNFLAERFMSDFLEKYPDNSIDEVEMLFSFIIGGATDLLVAWLRNGQKENRYVIAQTLGQFSASLVNSVNKKLIR